MACCPNRFFEDRYRARGQRVSFNQRDEHNADREAAGAEVGEELR